MTQVASAVRALPDAESAAARALLDAGFCLLKLSDAQAAHLCEARAAAAQFFSENTAAEKQLCQFLPEQLGYSAALAPGRGVKEQFLIRHLATTGGESQHNASCRPFPWPDHPVRAHTFPAKHGA
eukprot:SAG31_NODE_7016_length_1816_cov_1.650553_1_plen_125_part_00